jgi:hypothetical protein
VLRTTNTVRQELRQNSGLFEIVVHETCLPPNR